MKKKLLISKIILNSALFCSFVFAVICVHFADMTNLKIEYIINISLGLLTLAELCVLCFAHSIDRSSYDKTSQLFYCIIVLVFAGVVCDNLGWLVDGKADYIRLNYALSGLSYLIMPLAGLSFYKYQSSVFAVEKKPNKAVSMFISVASVLDIAFIVIGTATKYIFSIDNNGLYQEGKGISIVYVYPLIVLIVCIIEILHRKLEPRKSLALLLFAVTPLVAAIASFFLMDYSFSYVMLAMDMMLIYGAVQMDRGLEIAEKRAELAVKEREITENQTDIVISQIQPHFLYNTLTVIYSLCGSDTKLARKTINDFSNYLRWNMDSIKENRLVAFEKELEHIKTYLSIQLIRFEDILKVEYDINCVDFEIPALTLQPLIENAVEYGVRSRDEGGTVTISTKRENGKIYIQVHDDGVDYYSNKADNQEKNHVDIENARNRLSLICNGELTIESKLGAGTTATIILNDLEK